MEYGGTPSLGHPVWLDQGKAKGPVHQVFRGTWHPAAFSNKLVIFFQDTDPNSRFNSKQKLLDTDWTRLRIHLKLKKPSARKSYNLFSKSNIYKLYIAVSSIYSHWQIFQCNLNASYPAGLSCDVITWDWYHYSFCYNWWILIACCLWIKEASCKINFTMALCHRWIDALPL